MEETYFRMDEGYQFGLGVFETIAVEKGVPILLNEHVNRLERSMEFFGICCQPEDGEERTPIQTRITKYLSGHPMEHSALKIMVSQKNTILTHRANPYTEERYKKGFDMDYSQVYRNETSSLVYHKTMNYGDCILEKRKATAMGLDELIFLNSKGQICEGTTTNIFFVKDGKIFTPHRNCGLLPGIMRDWVMQQKQVEELELYPAQVREFEECFVTNSLMGIMPVEKLGEQSFSKRSISAQLRRDYEKIQFAYSIQRNL